MGAVNWFVRTYGIGEPPDWNKKLHNWWLIASRSLNKTQFQNFLCIVLFPLTNSCRTAQTNQLSVPGSRNNQSLPLFLGPGYKCLFFVQEGSVAAMFVNRGPVRDQWGVPTAALYQEPSQELISLTRLPTKRKVRTGAQSGTSGGSPPQPSTRSPARSSSLSHASPPRERWEQGPTKRNHWGVTNTALCQEPSQELISLTRLNGLNVTDKKYLRDGRWKKLPKYCRYCTSKKPRNRRRCCCSSINQFFILHRAITTRRTKEWTRHGIRREHSPGQFHI